MNDNPKFRPQQTKEGRWYVAVTTGHGPESHVGDFETEEEANNWIATKSKYWPAGVPKTSPPAIA